MQFNVRRMFQQLLAELIDDRNIQKICRRQTFIQILQH